MVSLAQIMEAHPEEDAYQVYNLWLDAQYPPAMRKYSKNRPISPEDGNRIIEAVQRVRDTSPGLLDRFVRES